MRKLTLIALGIAGIGACNQTSVSEKNDSSAQKTDSIPAPQPTVNTGPGDSQLTAFARFIAGMSQDLVYKQSATTGWQQYAKGNDENWKHLDEKIGDKIGNWVKTAGLQVKNEPRTLFYPFAGGDFYYPSLFFPEKDTTIMIGLEPCGTIFNPDDQPADTLSKYYKALQHSMFFPHRLGFFRTLSMKDDFNNHLLNGTMHTLLFYLARFGNDIYYIKLFNLNAEGNVINETDARQATGRYQAYRIGYSNGKGQVKEVIYISQDASDGGIKARPGLLKFLENRGNVATYFKAASYLMHYSTFSTVRNFVLNHSVRILQDDSGVPLKKLNAAGFDVHLYGNFTHTISLFKDEFQPDLKEAYANGKPIALPFVIGYTAPDGECNLQHAIKK